MPKLQAMFVVAASFRVPGLGVLVLPTLPAPAWLAEYALHTALSLTLLTKGQAPSLLTGTVEELAHDGQPPQRALLLDFDPGNTLLTGAFIQIGEAPLYS